MSSPPAEDPSASLSRARSLRRRGGDATSAHVALPRTLKDDLRRQGVTLVGVYVAVAAAWIAGSDRVLALVTDDPTRLVQLSVAKGIFFVLATAGLLAALQRRHAAQIERIFAAAEHYRDERTEQARRRRKAETIVDSTDDAIFSTTAGGVITSWNPAAERMFGRSAAFMIGRQWDDLVPTRALDDERAALSRVHAGERLRPRETTRLDRHGGDIPVAVTYSIMRAEVRAGAEGTEDLEVVQITRDLREQRAAESRAQQEQDFAHQLVESMPGVFYAFTRAGGMLRWNENFLRVSGYTVDEVRGMQPLDFFDDADREVVADRIAEAFDRGESSVGAAFRRKDGTTVPYFFTGRRTVLDGRECVLGVGLDMEKRLLAERELRSAYERYRSTLESILEGCQILDFDWRYLYLNAAAALQNRRPNEELLGQRMPEMWPGIEQTAVFAMLSRCLAERVPLRQEVEFQFADGSAGWFDVRVQPVPEGIFVFSIDITERKRAEAELRGIHAELERKVEERTRDLDAAKVRAEAADRIKSAFLATMSHELRTPLNSILGFTGIVLGGLAGPLSDEQSRQLGMVQTSARHLLDLINDVLDISKIEAGQLEVRRVEFEIEPAVQRAIASIRPLADRKALALDLRTEGTLGTAVGDPRRFEQILLNLLNNAVKFTDRGSVELSVRVDGDALICEVRDTGIGIRPEHLSELFQPFRQIDTGLQRQHEGTGLGLAICRRLADLLGGTIAAASEWGVGSCFTLRLPRARALR